MKSGEAISWVFAILWLGSILAGIVCWEAYAMAPGTMGRMTEPARVTGSWRLTIFVHPQCACTRKTLQGIRSLVLTEQDLRVRIAIVIPPDAPPEWVQARNCDVARAIPGAEIVVDDGSEARRHGAETSGHTEVVDPSGRLVFRGGLTVGRGRVAPTAEWFARVRCGGGERIEAPVYGCPLFSPNY